MTHPSEHLCIKDSIDVHGQFTVDHVFWSNIDDYLSAYGVSGALKVPRVQ